MKIEVELRPCIVDDRKALFHKWIDKSTIVEPSPMMGGHNGGVLKFTVGIIELEDGTVEERYPYKIKFLDNKIKDYCFNE